MCHEPLHHIVSFKIVEPYTLWVEFDDGSSQVINFKPVLAGEIYGALNDLEIFNQVRLDPESDNLIWPNDAEFDPADLHDWPEVSAEFVQWANSLEWTHSS
jgi:hypothetical protein